MDDTYLIEIRLVRTKWRIRELVYSVAQAFRIQEFMERHPHVTLFGPFSLKEGIKARDLLTLTGNCAAHYNPPAFTIQGWEKREGMHGSVIAFSVLPSEDLRKLTHDLAVSLLPFADSANPWDALPDKKWFHVTLANRLDPATGVDMFSRLTGSPDPNNDRNFSDKGILSSIRDLFRVREQPEPFPVFSPPLLDDTGLRITVMRGEDIFAEYDFFTRRWYMTGHDHASLSWQRTLQAYRDYAGFERHDPAPTHPEKIFVISDLHLGHANIIRYCSRPFLFTDVEEMDHVLIKNWNYSVSPQDRIFHLGDLRYGRDALPLREYQKKLHGQVTFIAGNHDEGELGAIPLAALGYDGLKFLLIHDPENAPESFDGWVIHGHYHNNDLKSYPFMNFTGRRINVSAEVIGYIPIGMDEISRLIHERMELPDNSPILLRYPQTT
jgi:calcineurin-like phosphoesterase family protein